MRSIRSLLLAALTTCALGLAMTPGTAQAEVRLHGEGGGFYTVSVMSWRDIPFRTVVRQQFDFSCGSAAVATLLRYHYGRNDVNEMHAFRAMYDKGDQQKIQQVGFSLLDMKQYLESQGYRADGFRISLDRLAAIGAPGIALITLNGYKHFVVVKGLRDGKVLVGDSNVGLRTYERAEFEAMWNGIILAIRSGPNVTDADLGFNRDSEWRPWSVAPIDDIGDRTVRQSDMLRELPTLYQITPLDVTNGGAP
jgi:hypothetical protein